MASRQYGLILGLIDTLPLSSKTRASLADDEEYVEHVREAYLKAPDEKKKDGEEQRPSMKEWSELREVGADIVDELRMVKSAVLASGGVKDSPKPYTRPKTLLMEVSASARITKRQLKHETLVNQLVPKKE